jgi:hypothetical protein
MNPISRLLLVLVLVLATGTVSASAGNPGIGNPEVVKIGGTLEPIPLIVPTAPCPGFAPDPLVFPGEAVRYDGLFKYWFEAPGFGEWLEMKTKWSGSVTVGNFTYALRGDLFVSEQAPAESDNFGSGTFVLTRSDGAKMRGDVRNLSLHGDDPITPLGAYVVTWQEVRCS